MKVKSHTKNTDQEENKKENKNKKEKNEIKQQTENIKKSKESLCIPQRDPATLILQNRYLIFEMHESAMKSFSFPLKIESASCISVVSWTNRCWNLGYSHPADHQYLQ